MLLDADAAMLATQLLKSPATLAAKGLPVRIKVKIYCYHATHRAMDLHALQLISQWGKRWHSSVNGLALFELFPKLAC